MRRNGKRQEKELVKCSKIDANNTTTLTYLKEVNRMLGIGEEAAGSSAKKKKAVAEETITYQSGNETIIQPLNVKEPRGTASILNIVDRCTDRGCSILFPDPACAHAGCAKSDEG